MTIETANREGRYEVTWRRRRGGEAVLVVLAGGLGLLFSLTPLVLVHTERGYSLAGVLVLETLILVAAGKLLAEGVRRSIVRSSLHVASGELEVRTGTGCLGRTRAFGSVEVDRVVLSRTGTGREQVVHVLLVPRTGPPVPLIPESSDEAASRDAALLLSQGVDVPLDDRRYVAPGTGGDGEPPARVACFEESRLTVVTWDYRDRLRPSLSLLLLGSIAASLAALPPLAESLGATVLAFAAGIALACLGLFAHVLFSLTVRRITLRPDAVRVERVFAGVPVLSRLVLYEELKAILIHRRGPLATVRFRLTGRRTAVTMPFEEPRIAAWLRHRVEQAAHQAGQRA